MSLMTQGGAVSVIVAALLLLMSIASWVVILWKAWLLNRAVGDVARSAAAFWQSASVAEGAEKVALFDREALLLPLITATNMEASNTLATRGDKSQQLTRVLREAMQSVLRRLQWGQVLLATAGSISPFIGLLGTVWGIFNALTGMAEGGPVRMEQIAGPVGEALVMTAVGLAVAIPAVMAYNLMGRRLASLDAELEGLAYDLRALAQAAAHNKA